jgi:hypothetical protein
MLLTANIAEQGGRTPMPLAVHAEHPAQGVELVPAPPATVPPLLRAVSSRPLPAVKKS